MAVASRLVSLITLSTLALLICSFQATPVNALSVERVSRGIYHRDHDALAKRKRSTNNNSKRCRPRPAPTSSSASASTTPAPSPTSSSSSQVAAPSKAPSQSPAPAPVSFSGDNPLGLRNKQVAGWTLDVNLLPKYNPSMIYNWSPTAPDGYEQFNTIFCPMFWGERDVGTWNSEIVGTGVVPKCIMGMNEPELPGQANMSPGRAAQLWRQYFNPLAAKGTYIFSPAPTSDPAGKTWLQNFFQQCPDCHVDAMAIHWYDISGDALVAYLNDMHSTFGRPIVLTEFACQNFNNADDQCNSGEVWAFEQQIKAFIDSTPWMMGAAPFGIFPLPLPGGVSPQNGLANGDGSPNALGQAWYSSS